MGRASGLTIRRAVVDGSEVPVRASFDASELLASFLMIGR
jgi:hypothetical protein